MAEFQLACMHHLGLTVSNLERSIVFYRDLLGLTLTARRTADAEYIGQQTGYPGLRLDVASFRFSDAERPSLELVQYLDFVGEASDPATNRAGNAHLCLVVDDLRGAYESLGARGVRFKTEPVPITSGPNRGGLVVYAYDPDDFIVELFEPASAAANDSIRS